MARPPAVGHLLPRAVDAWCDPNKLESWVLAERGHGREWHRVLQVEVEDAPLVWQAISTAILVGRIAEIRQLGDREFLCGTPVELAIRFRSAHILTAWHYSHTGAAPRLVTAYPRPYTRRRHGNDA